MKSVGAYEVKTHLSGLLKRVERGESFTVTENGVPVARLVPIQEKPRVDRRQAIEAIRRFRKEQPLGNVSVTELQEWINERRSHASRDSSDTHSRGAA